MSHPPYQHPVAQPHDTRMRAVLLIAVGMSAFYGLQVIVDMLRPHLADEASHPLIGLLRPGYSGCQQASFWGWVASVPLAGLIALPGWNTAHVAADAAARERLTRRWQAAATVVLLAPYSYAYLDFIGKHPIVALACVPSTAYALWLIHRMQRFRRMPVRLLLAVFAWGALIGVGFGYSIETWFQDYETSFIAQGMTFGSQSDVAKLIHQVAAGNLAVAGVCEELGKGLGVAVVYLLLRRHIDNVVSGIVLGAAAGVGFNLMESVSYMSAQGSQYAPSQYYLRQSLGLMTAHVAFTAAIGAGFGIARQISDPRGRRLAIACGFATAIAGHFANDTLIGFYERVKNNWFSPSGATDMLLFTPLTFLALQGPLVALYLVLLRRGSRDQAAALAVELRAEAATGFGAITAREITVLLRPMWRLRRRWAALQRGGYAAYRDQGRLFAAQLELGMVRWHRSRGESDLGAPDEAALRARIGALKAQRAVAQAAPVYAVVAS